MKARILSITGILTLIGALAGCGSSGSDTAMTIEVEKCADAGSIQIEIAYDASVLEPAEVKPAGIAGNAMIEANLDTPGKIIIGLIDSSGLDGTGTIAEVSFNVIDVNGYSPISVKNLLVNHAETLTDIPASTEDGQYERGSFTSLKIVFN